MKKFKYHILFYAYSAIIFLNVLLYIALIPIILPVEVYILAKMLKSGDNLALIAERTVLYFVDKANEMWQKRKT